jgi:membrane protein YqaA with SNARE-associated domain
MLPFFWLYWRSVGRQDKNKQDLSTKLEYFFSSKYANWLVFFWAMGEALVWFVIPEFLLLLLIFMRIKKRAALLYWDIYGTAAGTLLAYVISLSPKSIAKLPYIQTNMVKQVGSWYDKHGILGLVHQPFSGVPYKVFTFLAPHHHFFILWFLLFAVVVRISRYYIIFAILMSFYNVLHKYVYRNYVRLFVIATIIFSILLLRVYNEFGPGYKVSMGPNSLISVRW